MDFLQRAWRRLVAILTTPIELRVLFDWRRRKKPEPEIRAEVATPPEVELTEPPSLAVSSQEIPQPPSLAEAERPDEALVLPPEEPEERQPEPTSPEVKESTIEPEAEPRSASFEPHMFFVPPLDTNNFSRGPRFVIERRHRVMKVGKSLGTRAKYGPD